MKLLALLCAVALTAHGETPAPPRVEARSADLLAVGVVNADRMSIHVSRLIDNAPVRDAAITVVLRGVARTTTAEADGSYTLLAGDLAVPGAAVVEFQIVRAAQRETLKGTLEVAAAGEPSNANSGRQMWWWVLNFSVCIGFLLLLSRRRKSAPD